MVCGPATPSRPRPSTFWNAMTACIVPGPNAPVGAAVSYLSDASFCCSARTSGPDAP